MRHTSTCLAILLSLGACSDGDPPPADAPPAKDIGFNKPTASLKANMEMGNDNWVELGPADLSCLGTPANDPEAATDILVTTKVRDFQSGNPVPGTVVTVFKNQDVAVPAGPPVTADANADLMVTIPRGTKRFGYKMTHATALDTLLLNQTVAPNMPMQTVGAIQSVSKTTAQTLPALIGVSRTAGTGVLAGAVRDCKLKEISNFIATVSTTKGAVNHAPGADAYYFSPTAGLPVRHSQQAKASGNGLFMVIEMGATPAAYVQVWGYKDDADMASDKLTLIAELQTAVIADTVITGAYEPLRQ